MEYLLLNLSASQLIDIICISSTDGYLLREWWTHLIIDTHSDSHSGVAGRCASFQPAIYHTVQPRLRTSSVYFFLHKLWVEIQGSTYSPITGTYVTRCISYLWQGILNISFKSKDRMLFLLLEKQAWAFYPSTL